MVREGLRMLIDSHRDLEDVAEAGNGKDALELARQHHPDVVVIDVNMPVMNGIEATRHIKQEMSSICVIGLSSVQEETQSCEAMKAAGAIDLLAKSGPVNNLINTILQAVESVKTFGVNPPRL